MINIIVSYDGHQLDYLFFRFHLVYILNETNNTYWKIKLKCRI